MQEYLIDVILDFGHILHELDVVTRT